MSTTGTVSKVSSHPSVVSVAEEIFAQLEGLLEDVGGATTAALGTDETDLSKLASRRQIVVQQLLEILKTTPLTDPLLQPSETPITLPQFLDELSRERKELRTALRNAEVSNDNLMLLLENGKRRDEHILEIIRGIQEETNAIEDEDPAVQLRKLDKMKKEMMRAFNTILDAAYPHLKDDVKQIINELVEFVDKSPEPYMPIPGNVQGQALLLLARANIIELDRDTDQMKLLVKM